MTDVLGFADPRVLRAIQLVWKEAAALDAKDYRAWESMYTDDAYYVIPIDPDTKENESSLNMVKKPLMPTSTESPPLTRPSTAATR